MNAIDHRPSAYATISGVAAVIVLAALLHGQFVVLVAPEHFTVYHEPLGAIRHPHLLAAGHGALASLVPGLALGTASLIAGRSGARRPVPVRAMVAGAAAVAAAAELIALLAGAIVWLTGRPLLPAGLYPDSSPPLVIAQTIQIVYCGGAIGCSIAYLGWLHRRRAAATETPNRRGRNP